MKRISDRIAKLKPAIQNNDLVLILVYASPSTSSEEEIKNLYKLLGKTFQEVKQNSKTKIIIVGDFNSQIGKSSPEKRHLIGRYNF